MIALTTLVLLAGQRGAQQDVKAWEAAIAKQPNAANHRQLADAYLRNAQFDKAAWAFFKASNLYAKLGDVNAAKVLRTYGERYETKIDLFYERPLTQARADQFYTGARLEPKYGCYLGAFIDREDAIDTGFVGNGQSHKDPEGFNEATRKHHAVFFTYLSYGRPFPNRWVSVLKQRGAAAQIAWEPRSTSSVRDDRYLRDFADSCADSGAPIFLRFASEMNGAWTPYNGNPEAYKEMFRRVARVMHQRAPNVAMVWCPADIPEDRIKAYYPGQDAVDWVGVNFYSVIYNDGDSSRQAEWRNPTDAIKFVYNTYSKVHPMLVGEWAATHMSVVDGRERPEVAKAKIAQLYGAIPRLFPRLKAVHWLSANTIEHAIPTRQLNNFSLLDDSSITEKYADMVSAPYYLERVGLRTPPVAPVEYVPLVRGSVVGGKIKLSAVVKSYDQRPSVIWNVNGDPSSPKTEPGTYEVSVDTSKLKAQAASISVVVRDEKGRVAGRREVLVRIQN